MAFAVSACLTAFILTVSTFSVRAETSVHVPSAETIKLAAFEAGSALAQEIARRRGSMALADREQFLIGWAGILTDRSLTEGRQICVADVMPRVGQIVDSELRGSSFPRTHRYCRRLLEQAIGVRQGSTLYLDMAARELGLGQRFDPDRNAQTVGRKPVELIRAIRAAAEEGRGDYIGLAGRAQPLSCSLAADVGATWAAANAARVNRPELTAVDLEAAAAACYGESTAAITIRGQALPRSKAGLILGELIGRDVQRRSATVESGKNGAPSQ